eukprot:TRINITY_DN23265_c0_g1_i1.p1 TRINITY_DN23265_c0_g1~~TRINITY_DN23265_c0_g1_i1.p1  ORF type:complete len:1929 (+),score=360.45 TRINITY_DN23265_c0_g1_i1:747-5789(+)
MASARRLASRIFVDIDKAHALSFNYLQISPEDKDVMHLQSKRDGDAKTASVNRPANKHTVFQEICEYLSRAMEDPNLLQVQVAGLTRLTHTISQCHKGDMEKLRMELEMHDGTDRGAAAAYVKIHTMLRDFRVIWSRVSGPHQAELLLRAVAKMSVVDVHFLGDECMKTLSELAKFNPEWEDNIITMVQELVIAPLVEDEKPSADSPASPRGFALLRILKHFDCEKIASALAPACQVLTQMYCFALKEGDASSSAVTTDQRDALGFLMARLTRSEENVIGVASAAKGIKENKGLSMLINAVTSAISQIEIHFWDEDRTRQGSPESDLAKCSHIVIAKNLLIVADVDEALLRAISEKDIHRILFKKLLGAYGNRPTNLEKLNVDCKNLHPDDEAVVAQLFDVIAAIMATHPTVLNNMLQDDVSIVPYIANVMQCLEHPTIVSSLLQMALVCLKFCMARRHFPSRKKVMTELCEGLKLFPNLMQPSYILHLQATAMTLRGLVVDKAAMGKSQMHTLTEPVMHDILEHCLLIADLMLETTDEPMFSHLEQILDRDRNSMVFNLIVVPSPKVKKAAIEFYASSSSEASSLEVRELIALLDVKKEELATALPYLGKLVQRLVALLSGNNNYLRVEWAETSVDGVVSTLWRFSKFVPLHDSERALKLEVLKDCVDFILKGGTIIEWRKNKFWRKKQVSHTLGAVLQAESPDWEVPSICVERTWAGRSVEMLLLSLTGPGRLDPFGKVAFRVISRIADIVQGQSDKADASFEGLLEVLSSEEAKPWDVESIKRKCAEMNSIEEDDWRAQQEIFCSSKGPERILLFLKGVFRAADVRKARLLEFEQLSSAANFFTEVAAKVQPQADAESEDGVDVEDDEEIQTTAGPRILEMPGPKVYKGTENDFDDLGQSFVQKIGGAMSILLRARWDAFHNWSSVIDFGNGPAHGNIVIANQGVSNNLVFEIYRGSGTQRLNVPGAIQKGVMTTYLFTISETGFMRIYADRVILGELNGNFCTKRDRLKNLYVGKSCWPDRSNFEGCVEMLKISLDQSLEWEDLENELHVEVDPEESIDNLDRKNLMKVLMAVELTPDYEFQSPKKPVVHGASSLLEIPTDDKVGEEDSLKGNSKISSSLLLAGTLRSAFSVLVVPASTRAKADLLSCLLERFVIARLISLVLLSGPLRCGNATKLCLLMSLALESSGQHPELDVLPLFDLLMGFLTDMSSLAVNVMRQKEPEVAKSGEQLGRAIAHLASEIVNLVPYCSFSEDEEEQAQFVGLYFQKLIQLELTKNLVQMSVFAQMMKSKNKAVQVDEWLFDAKNVIVRLLENAPDVRPDVYELCCSHLLGSSASIGNAILTDLLEHIQQLTEAKRLEAEMAAKAFGTQQLQMEDAAEKTLASCKVEVFLEGARLQVQDSGHRTPYMNFVLTSKSINLVDVTMAGYPDTNSGILQKWQVEQLTRIVKGHLDQVIVLGFASDRTGDEEGFVVLTFLREKDRNLAISKLTKLKVAPVQNDRLIEEALQYCAGQDYLVAMLTASEYSIFGASPRFRLWVLGKELIHELEVDFGKWLPNPDVDAAAVESAHAAIENFAAQARSRTDAKSAVNWKASLDEVICKVSEPRRWAELDRFTFIPDRQPKLQLFFADQSSPQVIFFDDCSRDQWRDAMIELLESVDAEGGWAMEDSKAMLLAMA